jgi:hypothetical protein
MLHLPFRRLAIRNPKLYLGSVSRQDRSAVDLMPEEHDLHDLLREVLSDETDHPTRILKAAVIVAESLRRQGLDAVLVGGAAVEIHAPGAYTTTDLDFVVQPRHGVDFKPAITRRSARWHSARRVDTGYRRTCLSRSRVRSSTIRSRKSRLDPFFCG